MSNEDKYIEMLKEDIQECMKEEFLMSSRNQVSPISVPNALFYNPKYTQLSAGAKCLYILMLDRLVLLSANGWFDIRWIRFLLTFAVRTTKLTI